MSDEAQPRYRVRKTWHSEEFRRLKRDYSRKENQYYLLLNAVTLVVNAHIRPEYIVGFLRQEAIDAHPDSNKCLDSCKELYFCRLPKGHPGDHQEGNLTWPKASQVKRRTAKKKKKRCASALEQKPTKIA